MEFDWAARAPKRKMVKNRLNYKSCLVIRGQTMHIKFAYSIFNIYYDKYSIYHTRAF